MNPITATGAGTAPVCEPAAVVRRAVAALNALDAVTAEYLNALAFVLIRVARADGRVCSEERRMMEEILVDDAEISPEHAVLVTEIACHRAELADCGCAYGISRGLRSGVDHGHREAIVRFLVAVAGADGCFARVEHGEILQIAGELGIDPVDVFGRP
jgi:uncharacterized tellurite resistance protein B-like protein